MENKKVLGVALVAVIIAIGGLFYPQVQTQVREVFGAVSTLDGVDSPFVSINGARSYYYSQGIAATSSVVCIIDPPIATSTLVSYRVNVRTNGIGASQVVDISTTTATGGYGSSTPAFAVAVPVGTGTFDFAWQPNSATTSAVLAGGTG